MTHALSHGVFQLLVRVTAAPGRVEDTLRALSSIRMPAHLDSGCLYTHAGVDAGEPDICLYIEEWTDRDQLVRRIQSASFRALLMLMETSITSPFVEIRDVSRLGGLDYVARVCGQQEDVHSTGGGRGAMFRRPPTQ